MPLHLFLTDLAEHGRVKVSPPDGADACDDEAVASVLLELDRHARLELAFDAPAYRERPATWAAAKLYRACQLFVFREPDSDTQHALAGSCPEPVSGAVAYSVDLSFQFLPDLVTVVRAASATDPLIRELLKLAHDWPLSSVGIQSLDLAAMNLDHIMKHPGLRQLYVDRIIARRDLARAEHPSVHEAIRSTIGLFPTLAPAFAADKKHAEPVP